MKKVIRKKNNVTIKPLINVGALLDIPTGSWVTGQKGETIMNGGLSSIEGFAGLGNTFKSTIMHHMFYTAADRIAASYPELVMIETYDTEDNMLLNSDRFNNLANLHTEYLDRNPIDTGQWHIVTKSEKPANKWLKEDLYPLVNEKENDKDGLITIECFKDNNTGKPLKIPYPSFIEIDSLTEFESETTLDMLENLDEEKTNTLFMKQGLYKTKVLKDMPRLANKANIYFGFTTHLGKKIDMSGNPFVKPTKDLQFLKQDEKIKGATEKVMFLTTHYWKTYGTTALINQNTKQPEYPLYDNDVETDLNIVNIQQVRSKSGPSGYILQLVVSQSEGVLPDLTEFHYIKTNKFGIGGNPRSYWIELYPDVKLQRTTVRKKLRDDYKLRRAVNLTAELLQLSVFHPRYVDLIVDPITLREDIEKLGYDWNILLQTRGWWTPKQYDPNIRPFLSIVDLLKMRKGEYHPYWLDDNKKVKKEYQKHFEEFKEKEKKDGK